MSVVRKGFFEAVQTVLYRETIQWDHNKEQNSFYRYIVKNGVFHLLEQNRKDEALSRMAELYFMNSFLNSCAQDSPREFNSRAISHCSCQLNSDECAA